MFVSGINRGLLEDCRHGDHREAERKLKKMADRGEETGEGISDGQDVATRPASGGSKGSKGSEKTLGDAVSKLTVKALKEFRLSDPSDVDTTATGGESVPGINMTQEVPNIDLGPPPVPTFLSSEQEIGDELDEGVDEENILLDGEDSDEESDGESEMVVLDPDHVRFVLLIS